MDQHGQGPGSAEKGNAKNELRQLKRNRQYMVCNGGSAVV